MKVPRMLQAVLVIIGAYAGMRILFDVILGHVIPSSLLNMYMFFVVAGVFMVFTFEEKSARELIKPVKDLVENPSKRLLRNIVFLIVPLGLGVFTFLQMKPNIEAPVELRSIHPAPPSTVELFGKKFNLLTLTNPYRKFEKEDKNKFREFVAEGGRVYIQNCQFCHGDKLDGRGLYAQALNPTPLNFQDIGTIAQLQESFLFWRIATGGPGLPKEAAPWLSSMPIWQNFLSEEEIWKVILYLYDYTGHRPRSWEN